MRNYARFIPGEEIEAVEQWNFGAIDTAAQMLAAQTKARELQAAVAQDESVREQAFEAGFTQGMSQGMAQGLAQGLAQGQRQAQEQAQREMQDFINTQARQAGEQVSQLFAAAQSQLQEAEQVMAQGVLALACELARQVLRRELTLDPEAVMPVLCEALELLGTECKSAVIRMNPLDVDLLGEQIHADFAGLALNLRPDASVLQGGCLVESAGAVVDGTLGQRWQRAVASLGLNSAWEVTHES